MNRFRLTPYRIAWIHFLINGLWILVDELFFFTVQNQVTLSILSVLKAWLYVAVPSIILYIIIRQFEKRLLQSKESYRQLIELLPTGIIVHQNNNIVFANPAASMLLEATDSEKLIDRSLLEFIPEKDWSVIQKTLDELNDGTKPVSTDLKLITTGQKQIDSEIVAVRTKYNTAPAIQLNLSEVTERRRAEDALKASEQEYRYLFKSNPQPMCVVNRKTMQIVDVNDAMAQHYGYSHDLLRSMDLADIYVHKSEASLHLMNVENGFVFEEANPVQHKKNDGTIIEVELLSHSLTLAGKSVTLILVKDVTDIQKYERERTQMFQTLEQQVSERTQELEKRQRIAEGLTEIISVLNSNQPLQSVLDILVEQASRLLDADACSIYHLHNENVLRIQTARGLPDGFMMNADYPVGYGPLGRAVAEQKPVILRDVITTSLEPDLAPAVKALTKRTANYYQTIMAVPLILKEEIYGGIVLYYTQSRQLSNVDVDLASTFANQVALAIRNSQLLDEVEEFAVTEERNRLARELHDAVTQTLFATTLIAEALPEIWVMNPEEGSKRLEELRILTRGALAEMRMLLLELRPTSFKGMNLDELLHQLVEAIAGRARIPVELRIEGKSTITDSIQLAFYRISQEALNNVVKHANATQAVVKLRYDEHSIDLQISDDGCGFDIENISSGHLGLGIIQERVEAIKADLKIQSLPEEGTKIQVVWHQPQGINDE